MCVYRWVGRIIEFAFSFSSRMQYICMVQFGLVMWCCVVEHRPFSSAVGMGDGGGGGGGFTIV